MRSPRRDFPLPPEYTLRHPRWERTFAVAWHPRAGVPSQERLLCARRSGGGQFRNQRVDVREKEKVISAIGFPHEIAQRVALGCLCRNIANNRQLAAIGRHFLDEF